MSTANESYPLDFQMRQTGAQPESFLKQSSLASRIIHTDVWKNVRVFNLSQLAQ